MADNTPIVDASSVTESIATDELATLNGVDVSGASPRIKAQRVKVQYGDDGSATDVSAANPLPIIDTRLPAALAASGGVKVDISGTGANATAIKVDGSAVTQPVSGTVTVGSEPAKSRTVDSIAVSQQTDALMNGLTALTPLFAKISASASGANTLVAAVASKQIRVLQFTLVTAGAVNVKFQSHVTPTDLTGLMDFSANGGISAPFCPVGLFQTVSGEALDLNLSAAVNVGGWLVYVTV